MWQLALLSLTFQSLLLLSDHAAILLLVHLHSPSSLNLSAMAAGHQRLGTDPPHCLTYFTRIFLLCSVSREKESRSHLVPQKGGAHAPFKKKIIYFILYLTNGFTGQPRLAVNLDPPASASRVPRITSTHRPLCASLCRRLWLCQVSGTLRTDKGRTHIPNKEKKTHVVENVDTLESTPPE